MSEKFVAQDQNPKFVRVHYPGNLWKLKLNLLLRTRHGKTTMAYLLLLIRMIVPPYVSIFSPNVCHQKLLKIEHREEVKVN